MVDQESNGVEEEKRASVEQNEVSKPTIVHPPSTKNKAKKAKGAEKDDKESSEQSQSPPHHPTSNGTSSGEKASAEGTPALPKDSTTSSKETSSPKTTEPPAEQQISKETPIIQPITPNETKKASTPIPTQSTSIPTTTTTTTTPATIPATTIPTTTPATTIPATIPATTTSKPTTQNKPMSRRDKKRAKRAARKQRAKDRKKTLFEQETKIRVQQMILANKQERKKKEDDVEIVWRAEDREDRTDPELLAFTDVFERFMKAEDLTTDKKTRASETQKEETVKEEPKKEVEEKIEEDEDDELEDDTKTISNKKRKLASRLPIAKLKTLVQRPDIVELHDPNSSDPLLLVHLKAYRNTVPVPPHWCQKRKYLQGKRGIEKEPFKLPSFIEETGICEIRAHQQDEMKDKSIKQRQRDRMNPKMGRMDIDYKKLHEAFFKYSQKPKMTGHGDLYYEGKEFEVKYSKHKPGHLSTVLREALHMTDNSPPPWLINMQRFGPPPSYPDLKIPGLNAPLPSGCKYGYAEGQWGKPPVDQVTWIADLLQLMICI